MPTFFKTSIPDALNNIKETHPAEELKQCSAEHLEQAVTTPLQRAQELINFGFIFPMINYSRICAYRTTLKKVDKEAKGNADPEKLKVFKQVIENIQILYQELKKQEEEYKEKVQTILNEGHGIHIKKHSLKWNHNKDASTDEHVVQLFKVAKQLFSRLEYYKTRLIIQLAETDRTHKHIKEIGKRKSAQLQEDFTESCFHFLSKLTTFSVKQEGNLLHLKKKKNRIQSDIEKDLGSIKALLKNNPSLNPLALQQQNNTMSLDYIFECWSKSQCNTHFSTIKPNLFIQPKLKQHKEVSISFRSTVSSEDGDKPLKLA